MLTAVLILIDLKEFDDILEMDWLSMHRAKVDCLRKEVVFHTLDGHRICFTGKRNMMSSYMISALTANRLLRKGCEAFLACVVNSEGTGSNLADNQIVCRLLDVFSEELSWLPLVRTM